MTKQFPSVSSRGHNGAIGKTVWSANLLTDGSNPGAGAGTHVTVTPDLDPAGVFKGQWIKTQALDDPVPTTFCR